MKNRSIFAILRSIGVLFASLFLLFGIVLVVNPLPCFFVQASTLPSVNRLSEMTDEECICFLKDNDIEIPTGLSSSPSLGSFIHDIIQ